MSIETIRSTSTRPAPSALPMTVALRPMLVIVGAADHCVPHTRADAGWLDALPDAHRVLAVGDDAHALCTRHQARHPHARWWSTSFDADAPIGSMQAMASLPDEDWDAEPIDLLVLGRGLAIEAGAAARLRALSQHCADNARLIAHFDNAASAGAIERLFRADEPVDAAMSRARQLPSTLYKAMLDAGWMPHLVRHAPDAVASTVGAALGSTGSALGLGNGALAALRTIDSMVVSASRLAPAAEEHGPARFTVVVPTTDDAQLRSNVECSPGLLEVDARVVSIRGAASPGETIEMAQAHVSSDWVLLSHQDVYFGSGFGARLNAILAAIPAHERPTTVIGFVGKGVDRATRTVVSAGHVIDRLHRADFDASDTAVSIDELAIVVARDSLLSIDPRIGWHLWATDLCLDLIEQHGRLARIVRLPVFHNSRTGWTLPSGFFDSARYLIDKHPQTTPIHTLCGVIDDAFIAARRGGQAS